MIDTNEAAERYQRLRDKYNALSDVEKQSFVEAMYDLVTGEDMGFVDWILDQLAEAEAEVTAYEEQLTAREQDWDDEHARAERLLKELRAFGPVSTQIAVFIQAMVSASAQVQDAHAALQPGDLGETGEAR